MASIFDLKTNVSELAASNAGVARNNYEQYAPLREVNATTFSQGQINFRFETTGTKWWVPNKTYFRVRCKLSSGSKNTLRSLTQGDAIAPNVNLMNNLFQSAELQINNRTVSKITDFMGQISMLETRLTKTKQWKENIGKYTSLITPSFSERQQIVSTNGVKDCEDTIAWTNQNTLGYKYGEYKNANNLTGTVQLTAQYVPARGVTLLNLVTLGPENENKFVTPNQNLFGPNLKGGITAGVTVFNSWKVGDIFRLTRATYNDDGSIRAKTHIELPVVGVGMNADAELVDNSALSSRRTIVLNGAWPSFADGAINTPVVIITGRIRDDVDENPTSLVYFERGRKENCADQAQEFELIWTPPLSIFKVPHAIPPGARVDIFLNPHNENTYQFMAIETLPPYSAQPTDFTFNVTNMFLYVNTLEGARVENLTYLLDLESTVCFSENIASDLFSQKNFDVPTSTYALTLAYQDRKATSSNSAYSASKFHVGPTGIEKYISRFYISYAGQQLPQPDADPKWDETNHKKYLTQRWAESIMYSNGHLDPFVTESESEWLQYGPYFHFAWPRDAADRSTRVQIFQQFDTEKALNDVITKYPDGVTTTYTLPVPPEGLVPLGYESMDAYAADMTKMQSQGNMLLFAHYREVARVTIQDSRVVNVELEIA
jgi:hypothetical protein